jgi:hypothetical protein
MVGEDEDKDKGSLYSGSEPATSSWCGASVSRLFPGLQLPPSFPPLVPAVGPVCPGSSQGSSPPLLPSTSSCCGASVSRLFPGLQPPLSILKSRPTSPTQNGVLEDMHPPSPLRCLGLLERVSRGPQPPFGTTSCGLSSISAGLPSSAPGCPPLPHPQPLPQMQPGAPQRPPSAASAVPRAPHHPASSNQHFRATDGNPRNPRPRWGTKRSLALGALC